MKAIVTGSSRGLGLAIAGGLLEEGHSVSITSRSKSGLDKALENLKSKNFENRVFGYVVDFGDQKSVEGFTQKSIDDMGGIDILVNNVGIYSEDTADSIKEDDLNKMINVNLMSSVRMNESVLGHMKVNKSGYIFNVVSIATRDPRGDAASYTISKAALKMYSDLLRESLKEFGIRVTSIFPGPMNTSSWDDIDVDHSKLIQMKDMMSLINANLSMSENSNVEEIVINTVGGF